MKSYFTRLAVAAIFLLLTISVNTSAFNNNITFTGSGASSTVESVIVQNLTKGTTVTVPTGNTLNLYDVVSSIDQPSINDDVIHIYPNPIQDKSNLTFFAPQAGNTQINVFGVDGRSITGIYSNLLEGQNQFQLSLAPGVYILKVNGNGYNYASRVISQSNSTDKPTISFLCNQKLSNSQPQKNKNGGSVTSMLYSTGDQLVYKGTSGNYTTIVTDKPTESKSTNFDFVECKDADGNNYSVVKIGTQTWMAENLKTTAYRNGVTIDNVTDSNLWTVLLTGAWCDYSNTTANGNKYGHLYNWYAVDDIRKIAPTGWHVPTDAEWTILPDYLGGESLAGAKLKESGLSHWLYPNNGATNETGFFGLPGALRYPNGLFNSLGYEGNWWSSNQGNTTSTVGRTLTSLDSYLFRASGLKQYGFSVRCVKDNMPTLITSTVSTILKNTATSGGDITDDGGTPITGIGICWSKTTLPTVDLVTKTIETGTTGTFTSSMTNLIPNTTYYVRAYATNSEGTAYGNEETFTTLSINLPTLTSTTISTITKTTAIGGGNITDDGGSAITARGICWSTTTLPTSDLSTKTTETGTIGAFSSSITNLTANTTYYVRAYATNSVGTAYGNEVVFTTLDTHSTIPINGLIGWWPFTGNANDESGNGNNGTITGATQTTDRFGKVGNSLLFDNSVISSVSFNLTKTPENEFTYQLWVKPTRTINLYSETNICPGSGNTSLLNSNQNWAIAPTHGGNTKFGVGLSIGTNGLMIAEHGSGILVSRLTYTADINNYSHVVIVYRTDSILLYINNNLVGKKLMHCNSTVKFISSFLGCSMYSPNFSGLIDDVAIWNRALSKTEITQAFQSSSYILNPSLPELTTADPLGILTSTATTGGIITSDVGSAVTSRGVCWSTSTNPKITDNKTTDGNGIGAFSSSINGLFANTTYYIRAYATSSVGTAYGNEVSFKTLEVNLPSLTTNTISTITNTTAISGGNITIDGGAPITARGICWSTTTLPTVDLATKTTETGTIGAFSSSMTNLTANTTYYIRAYATNSKGTAYGNEITFSTLSVILPTLITTAISTITKSSAIGGGTVTVEDAATIITRGVCWSTTTLPTVDLATKTTETGTSGTFTSSMTNLIPNTTYYVRAYATNLAGTAYGNEVSFITQNSQYDNITEKVSFGNYSINNSDECAEICSVDTTQWHSFAVSISGASVKLYLDGSLIKSSYMYTGQKYPYNNVNWYSLYIGASLVYDFNTFYKGYFDELRISNCVRTDTEISNTYKNKVEFINDANTIGLWHFSNEISNVVSQVQGSQSGDVEFSNGIFGKCLNFKGINGYVDCNYNMPEKNITIEFWAKFNGNFNSINGGTLLQPYGMYSGNITVVK